MKILKSLWRDDTGVIMSAETVMLGTIGVLAMTAGVGVMATAVNGELGEMGMAFRSFDQSFSTPGFRTSFGNGTNVGISNAGGVGVVSGTVGSSYVQPPVDVSRAQLQIELQQSMATEKELAGRVIQRLDAAQLQNLQEFSGRYHEGVGAESEL
mgnify:CR=1 FL=1